ERARVRAGAERRGPRLRTHGAVDLDTRVALDVAARLAVGGGVGAGDRSPRLALPVRDARVRGRVRVLRADVERRARGHGKRGGVARAPVRVLRVTPAPTVGGDALTEDDVGVVVLFEVHGDAALAVTNRPRGGRQVLLAQDGLATLGHDGPLSTVLVEHRR